jgi:hypothetical protein
VAFWRELKRRHVFKIGIGYVVVARAAMRVLRDTLFGLLLIPFTAGAHHSFAEFNQEVFEEHDGEIVDIFWRNPHVRMSIRTEDETGNEVIWRMEAQDLNTLGRIGVSRDLFDVGQRVRFAGWPSTRQAHYLALTHLLLEEGTEVVVRMRMAPRWTGDAIGGGDITNDPLISESAEAEGIFRVWSFLSGNRPAFTDDPPLTETARAAYEAFDPVRDDPVLRCAQPGMPEAITFIGPHPIEFVDEGERILLRIESDDVVRVIHMDGNRDGVSEPLSPLGFSVGRWLDDRTLEVTTTRVSWPYTKINGLVAVPQSADSVFVERFAMSADERRLTLSFSITDPVSFTRTVMAEAYTKWQWLPGAVIEPYECTLDE